MRWISCLLCAAATALWMQPVAAQSVTAHGAFGLSKALGGHQGREFDLGVTGLGALELGLARGLGVELQGGGIFLTEGDPPEDPTLQPLGSGSATLFGLGLRAHPLGPRGDSPAGGLWLAAHASAAATGGVVRPSFDAQLGFDFSAGPVGVGPVIGYTHIFQPDDQLRPADARVPFFGVHLEVALSGAQPAKSRDRDHDGILDEVDACPDVPEDKDGFEDEDGCPEADNDKDGVLDGADNCPLIPEDRDGFEDADGCPDPDNDKDGLLDVNDKCPDEPEDMDDFEDEDGCPEPDNDQDGLLDAQDLCPNEAETINGYADHDGCPDSEQIRVVGDKIVLDDRVHFRTNSAILRVVSYPLLERLAKLILEHPEYIHIQVEGHTDVRGGENFNKRLSEDRAASVSKFLVSRGVKKERLNSIGYGSSRPLIDKRSEHAWFMNRRVEFTVTRERRVVNRSDGRPDGAKDQVVKPPVDEDERPPEDAVDPETKAGGDK